MSSVNIDIKPLVSVIIVTYNRKGDVIECIDSVLKSSYEPIEIIVVDNASIDGSAEELEHRYQDKIKLIKNNKNLYAAGARNIGAKLARGKYLLFIDSDNVIDVDMISNLIRGEQENKNLNIGMCGPFNYVKLDPQRLCWTNNKISLLTSITSFKGVSEIDNGQYQGISFIKVDHIPNVFMVSEDTFKKVGGIDEDYVIHYEESDLAQKLRRLGYEIVLFPQAKTWHNVTLNRKEGHKSFKGQNPKMVYYVLRNRIYFMRKNSSGLRLFLFLLIFNNLFLIFNLFILLFNRKLSLISLVLRGYRDGLFTPLSRR